MKRAWGCYAARVALAGFVAAAAPVAYANDAARCASAQEADAFELRALQSRLMVAALSCNQQAAYNTFVEKFRPTLTSAGHAMQSYYARTGGGETALNRYVTSLANAAGLSRAEKPQDFCSETWTMFLLLQDEPDELPTIAAKHDMSTADRPHECAAPADVSPVIAGVIKAAAP
jgi:hypothetical protein